MEALLQSLNATSARLLALQEERDQLSDTSSPELLARLDLALKTFRENCIKQSEQNQEYEDRLAVLRSKQQAMESHMKELQVQQASLDEELSDRQEEYNSLVNMKLDLASEMEEKITKQTAAVKEIRSKYLAEKRRAVDAHDELVRAKAKSEREAQVGDVSSTDTVVDASAKQSDETPTTQPATAASQADAPASTDGNNDSAATNEATPAASGTKRLDFRAQAAAEIRENIRWMEWDGIADNIAHSKDDLWLLSYNDLLFIEKIGTGASSTVFEGTFKKDTPVAIKVLRLDQKQKDLKDFKKELYIMSQVISPYVVKFYGATLEPKLCVVMENCSKGTLFHYLQDTESPLDWSRVFAFALDIIAGIQILHNFEPPIVHRDLKPLNLLLADDYTVKVCDFGLSRFTSEPNAEEMQTLTKLRGTYTYTAPEIYHKSQYSAKSDIYSVGVIFWEMATRYVKGSYERPYSEYPEIKHDYQIIYQTATNQKRPSFHKDIPMRFKQIIGACWMQVPDRRPTAEQLHDGLTLAREDYNVDPAKWTPSRLV